MSLKGFGNSIILGVSFCYTLLMKNQEIAGIFNEIAGLLEIKGENPFRIRAYRRAAQNIEGHAKNIADLSREELLEIPGIGKDLADKIEEYLKTGKVASYEDLKKRFPKVLLISFLCQASVRKQQNSFTKN